MAMNIRFLPLGILPLLLLHCGSGEKEETVAPRFSEIQIKIFNQSCTSSSCHGAQKAGGLDLQVGVSYGNLVSADPTNPPARNKGYKRVYPGDPDKSFLIHKLRGTLSEGEGSRMPAVGGPLSEAKIQAIEQWIRDGALNN